jgi:capsular polysaccharide biosynthesis protein/glycosyltransferase involved in cell wall biosynthesis
MSDGKIFLNQEAAKAEGPGPKVSIVVATRNRKRDLERCLRSLEAELADPSEVEILVVDSGSRDDTCRFLAGLAAPTKNGAHPRIPVRYLYQKNAAASVARNLGAREARGEWVAFLDDDCEVQPGWFRELHRALRPGVEAVGGPALVPEGNPYPKWFRSGWESLDLGSRSGPFEPSLYPMECNLAVRRSRFQELAGMNPNLGPSAVRQGFHEGPELIRRLRKHCPEPDAVWYQGGARVWHRIDPGKVRVRSRLVRSFFAGIDHTRAQKGPRGGGWIRLLQNFLQALGRLGSCLWQPAWARLRMGKQNWIEWLYVTEARNFYRLGEKVQDLIGEDGPRNFSPPPAIDLKRWVRVPLLRVWKAVVRHLGLGGLPWFVIPDLIEELQAGNPERSPNRILWSAQPAEELRTASHIATEDAHPHLLDIRLVERPWTWIATLEEAEVHGQSVAVTTQAGGLVAETSIEWGHAPEEHGVMRRFFLPAPVRLAGKSLLLGSTGGNTYHHWMLDILPRLRLLAAAGLESSDFDHILVNGFQLPFQKESLEAVGIPLDRCRPLNDRVRYRCEELILPSLPAPLGHPARDNLKFLQSIFLPKTSAGGKRLLVGREPGQSRQVTGWSELREKLMSGGFEECLPGHLSVKEQARLFASADWVVGVHGSALTNLAFCRLGTRVLEIFGWNYVNPCYRDLCGAAGLIHHAVIGEGPGQPHLCLDLDDASGDIRIRPEKILTLLNHSGCLI